MAEKDVRRTARTAWTGSLPRGMGRISGETGALDELPVDRASRIGEPNGKASPEELLAAQSACLAMAIAGHLTGAGAPPVHLTVAARCSEGERDGGYAITEMAIEVEGEAPGIDEAGFSALVAEATAGCPITKAIRGSVAVTVRARLMPTAVGASGRSPSG